MPFDIKVKKVADQRWSEEEGKRNEIESEVAKGSALSMNFSCYSDLSK